MNIIFQGFSMSLADSVPGVSGGTIAYILGFYEQFIGALQGIFRKTNTERTKNYIYLMKFAVGWGIGMSLSVLLLAKYFNSSIYFMCSMFLGLTAAAIPFIIYTERSVLKNHYFSSVFMFIGVILVVALSEARAGMSGIYQLDFTQLGILQYIFLIIAGFFAVSAMLLPGISGSTLLLIFGVYMPLITAIKEVLHFHLAFLPGVLSLAFGVMLGIILASRAIRDTLRKHRTQMVYLIIGLMVGSLYAIIMGPTTLSVPKLPVSLDSFQLSAFIVGIMVLVLLEGIRLRSQLPEKNNV